MATNVPFKTGDVIQQKYTLQVRIGAGTYGVIFQALYKTEDIYKHVAIKLEKSHPQQYTLQISEIIVMKAMIGSKHFAKFFQCGTHDQYKFVVMELLGPSLLRLVNRKRPYYFTLLQLLKFGTQAVKILQELHKAGFVHRDVKPDNFVIGNSLETAGTIYLIDFGLCKQLNKKDGLIIKPTAPGSFRGTMRYASPNAHKHIELGRQDDLISLLYMMIEFYAGKLPWSSQTTDEVKISLLKEQSTPDILLNKMPTVFHEFYNHIFTLDYEDEPDYDMLVDLFKEAAKDQKLDLDSPFEWEQELKNQRAIVTKQQRIDFPFVNNMSTQQQLESMYKDQIHPTTGLPILEHLHYQRTNLNLVYEIKEFSKQLFQKQKMNQLQQNNVQQLNKQQEKSKQEQNNQKAKQYLEQNNQQQQQKQNQQQEEDQQQLNIPIVIQIRKTPIDISIKNIPPIIISQQLDNENQINDQKSNYNIEEQKKDQIKIIDIKSTISIINQILEQQNENQGKKEEEYQNDQDNQTYNELDQIAKNYAKDVRSPTPNLNWKEKPDTSNYIENEQNSNKKGQKVMFMDGNSKSFDIQNNDDLKSARVVQQEQQQQSDQNRQSTLNNHNNPHIMLQIPKHQSDKFDENENSFNFNEIQSSSKDFSEQSQYKKSNRKRIKSQQQIHQISPPPDKENIQFQSSVQIHSQIQQISKEMSNQYFSPSLSMLPQRAADQFTQREMGYFPSQQKGIDIIQSPMLSNNSQMLSNKNLSFKSLEDFMSAHEQSQLQIAMLELRSNTSFNSQTQLSLDGKINSPQEQLMIMKTHQNQQMQRNSKAAIKQKSQIFSSPSVQAFDLSNFDNLDMIQRSQSFNVESNHQQYYYPSLTGNQGNNNYLARVLYPSQQSLLLTEHSQQSNQQQSDLQKTNSQKSIQQFHSPNQQYHSPNQQYHSPVYSPNYQYHSPNQQYHSPVYLPIYPPDLTQQLDNIQKQTIIDEKNIENQQVIQYLTPPLPFSTEYNKQNHNQLSFHSIEQSEQSLLANKLKSPAQSKQASSNVNNFDLSIIEYQQKNNDDQIQNSNHLHVVNQIIVHPNYNSNGSLQTQKSEDQLIIQTEIPSQKLIHSQNQLQRQSHSHFSTNSQSHLQQNEIIQQESSSDSNKHDHNYNSKMKQLLITQISNNFIQKENNNIRNRNENEQVQSGCEDMENVGDEQIIQSQNMNQNQELIKDIGNAWENNIDKKEIGIQEKNDGKQKGIQQMKDQVKDNKNMDIINQTGEQQCQQQQQQQQYNQRCCTIL